MSATIRLEQVPTLFSEGIEAAELTLAERRKRREAILSENFVRRARRIGASLAQAADCGRLRTLAAGLDLAIRDRAIAPAIAPHPDLALAHPDGLCCLATDLSPAAIMDAYSHGLLLFAPLGPAAWWSPSRRVVANPGSLHPGAAPPLSSAQDGLTGALDRAFDDVLAICSRPDRSAGRLGFGPRLIRAYADLHDAGFAHSFELTDGGGKLIAGGFGISVGRTFVTEAWFGPPDVAEAALILLDRRLACWGYAMHEARLAVTPGAELPKRALGLGFRPMARQDFIERMKANLRGGRLSRWRIEPPFEENDGPANPEKGEPRRQTALASAA